MTIKNFNFSKDYLNSAIKNFFLYGDLIFILVLSLIKGPWLQVDTGSYLSYSPQRSPLYPVLMQVYQWLFYHNFWPLVVFQVWLGWGAMGYVAKRVIQHFGVGYIRKDMQAFALRFLLAIPYIFFLDIGRSILTEALCYPLFLVVVWQIFHIFKYPHDQFYKKSALLIFWLTLLVLTRRQFLFFYPMLVAGALLLSLQKSHKQAIWIFLGCILSYGSAHVVESGYNYMHTNHFRTVPFVGMQTVNAPLFVSRMKDIDTIEDPLQKELSRFVKGRLLSERISPYNEEVSPYFIDVPPYFRFFGSYNPICFDFVSSGLARLKMEWNPYTRDDFLVKLTWTLIQLNPLEYIKLIGQNFIKGLGDYYHTALVFMVFIFTTFLCFSRPFIKSSTPVSDWILWFWVLSLMLLGNQSLVSIVELTQSRYVFYGMPLWIGTWMLLLANTHGPEGR